MSIDLHNGSFTLPKTDPDSDPDSHPGELGLESESDSVQCEQFLHNTMQPTGWESVSGPCLRRCK